MWFDFQVVIFSREPRTSRMYVVAVVSTRGLLFLTSSDLARCATLLLPPSWLQKMKAQTRGFLHVTFGSRL